MTRSTSHLMHTNLASITEDDCVSLWPEGSTGLCPGTRLMVDGGWWMVAFVVVLLVLMVLAMTDRTSFDPSSSQQTQQKPSSVPWTDHMLFGPAGKELL